MAVAVAAASGTSMVAVVDVLVLSSAVVVCLTVMVMADMVGSWVL